MLNLSYLCPFRQLSMRDLVMREMESGKAEELTFDPREMMEEGWITSVSEHRYTRVYENWLAELATQRETFSLTLEGK
jgi:hypothetical protein